MRKFSRESFNITEAINELMHESGVIIFLFFFNFFSLKIYLCVNSQEKVLILLKQ